MKYRAFISYSRAADEQLAQALQAGLRDFAKPLWRMSALRIFRDRTNLSVNPDLFGQIQEALDESDYFILMASPQAASSKWVRLELEHFLKHRSIGNVLIVLTDGSMIWDDESHDFDWRLTNALPSVLQKRFYAEPLYLALGWAKQADDLSVRNPRFADAIADLAATLHGKPKDELIGDDIRQHRRFRLLVRSFVTALSILLVLVWFFWYRATVERDLAIARQLAAQSEQVLERQHDLALARSLAADETASTTETRRALFRAVSWNPQAIKLLHANGARTLAFSRDGRFLAISRDHGIDVWNLVSWQKTPLCHDIVRDELRPLAISADGALVAAASGRLLVLWDVSRDSNPEDCGAGATLPYSGIASLAFSPDGQSLGVGVGPTGSQGSRSRIELRRLTRTDGRIAIARSPDATFPVPGDGLLVPANLAFGPDGASVRAVLRSGDQRSAGSEGIYRWMVASPASLPEMMRRTSGALVLNADGSAVIPERAPASDRTGLSAPAILFERLDGASVALRTDSSLNSLAATSSGQLAAGVDGCGLVMVLESNKRSLPRPETRAVAGDAIESPDVFTSVATDGGRVDLWNLRSGEHRTLTSEPGWRISDARFLPRRHLVAIVQVRLEGQDPPRLQFRSVNGGQLYWELPSASELLPFALTVDGRLLAQGASSISIWDVDKRRRVTTLIPRVSAMALAFNRDGTRLLVGSGEILGLGAIDAEPLASLSIDTWSMLTSQQPRRIAESEVTPGGDATEAIVTLRYDPRGRILGAATSTRLLLLGDAKGELGSGARDFAFSSDGTLAAVLSDGRIDLWDVQSRERLGEVPIDSVRPTHVWFTSDDRYLVYADTDGLATVEGPGLWRTRARRLLGGTPPAEACAPEI